LFLWIPFHNSPECPDNPSKRRPNDAPIELLNAIALLTDFLLGGRGAYKADKRVASNPRNVKWDKVANAKCSGEDMFFLGCPRRIAMDDTVRGYPLKVSALAGGASR